MNLSIIIVSYNSEKLLNKVIKKIPKENEIIIIENSLKVDVKKDFEKKYNNTQVIIPAKNLGYASAFNLGFKKSKNNYVLSLTPDVIINSNLINQIIKIIKSLKDFTLIAPEYKNQKIYKNYIHAGEKRIKEKNISKFKLQEVKDIDWCFCVINKLKFKDKNILDENYFLYFETMDLCRHLFSKRHKMYVIKGLKFDHLGTSSSDNKFNNAIMLNRNWHFSWSKFYYFKKNNNYFYALKKISPNIYQGIKGIIISFFKMNLNEINLHLHSISGIINGIFLKKSHFRPNIKDN